MKTTSINTLFFVSLFFLTSCGPTPYYENSVDINIEDWKHNDKVNFVVEVIDVESKYIMNLIVSHSQDFSYQNLYLNVTTSFPTQEQTEERLNIELSDKKGQWVGKCSNGTCQTKVYMLDNFKFPEKGNYTFGIEQLNREESLKGINQIALEIYKVEGQG